MSRKEGGRGLVSIEDNIGASIQRLEDYIEKSVGRLITATRNNTDDTRISRTEITKKQKWEEKKNPWTFLVSNKRLFSQKKVDVV